VPWKVALRLRIRIGLLRIGCQNYVPWKVALRHRTVRLTSDGYLIRIMCHEKLHWDPIPVPPFLVSWYQNYVPWKVALRRVSWVELVVHNGSELCAMKSCTETVLLWRIAQITRIRVMCHEKLHWDRINWLYSVSWQSELCAMKSCTETIHVVFSAINFNIRIMCHEKLHWDCWSCAFWR